MPDQAAHRMVVQVSRGDPEGMHLALGNALASHRLFRQRGERFEVELVAYGPGIAMLREDISPVKDRIAGVRQEIPELVLSMCGNAKAAAEANEGHPVSPLPGVRVVPSGVVRVMELEEQGRSYVRP